MVGINQIGFHRVNKQMAFKHLVRRDRGGTKEAPWRDVSFSSEIC